MTASDHRPSRAVGGLERFTAAAARLGVEVAPVKYPQGTRTAVDAAAAISCDVSQIAKSLVLQSGDGFVLALTAGHNRVDLEKLAALTGSPVKMADPDRARDVTGFSIGGTPPFAHATMIPTYIDPALMSHPIIYGAAGTPDTCFPIASLRLLEVTGAIQADFVVE